MHKVFRFGITEDLTQHNFVLTVFSFFLFPSSFSCLLNSAKNFIIRSLIFIVISFAVIYSSTYQVPPGNRRTPSFNEMTNPIKLDLSADHVYEHIDNLGGCHNNNPEPVYVDPVQKTREIVSKLQEHGPISHEQRVYNLIEEFSTAIFTKAAKEKSNVHQISYLSSDTCDGAGNGVKGGHTLGDTPRGRHDKNPEPPCIDPVRKTKMNVPELQQYGPISHEQRVYNLIEEFSIVNKRDSAKDKLNVRQINYLSGDPCDGGNSVYDVAFKDAANDGPNAGAHDGTDNALDHANHSPSNTKPEYHVLEEGSKKTTENPSDALQRDGPVYCTLDELDSNVFTTPIDI